MNKVKVRAFRALVKIRLRRQEGFDQARNAAQRELTRLLDEVQKAGQEVETAQTNVTRQTELIDDLTSAGRSFQIGNYLAQQDYHGTLQEKVRAAVSKETQCLSASDQQREVLNDARHAANRNLQQRERLQQKIAKILKEADQKQMDDQDEEAEESFVARKHMASLSLAKSDYVS
jgi:hypothetical protein